METNVNNYHPIGRDPESYHSGALVEAVTLHEISLSELISRYNLMIEYISRQDRRLKRMENTINYLKGQYDYDESVLVGDVIHRLGGSVNIPSESENAISG